MICLYRTIFFVIGVFAINTYLSQTTLTLQPDSVCGKDALIRSLSLNTNFGNNIDFNAHSWTNQGAPVDHRSLIEFDLSYIAASSTIISAYLSLYSYNSPAVGSHSTLSGSNEAVIQRITSPWNENTVTWGNQPIGSPINQVILPQSTNPIQDYLNIDVTNLVQDMISTPSTGHGFLFKLITEQYYRRMLFASSDNPINNFHPKLVVTYSTVNNLPNFINLGNDTTLCPGQNLQLDATTSSATYLWQDGSTDSTFNVTQQGLYWVEVTTCSISYYDTININYFQTQNINLGNDTTLCPGQNLQLDATTSSATYLWQDGSTDSTFNVTQQGLYWVEVTTCSISYYDTININYFQTQNINLGNDTTLCLGSSILLEAIIPNATYLWQDGSTDSTFNVSQQGLYWVEVTINNCSATAIIEINYIINPTVNLGNDTVICPGESIILNAEIPNSTYLWQDGSTNSTFSANTQETYWVGVSNHCGITMDSVYIEMDNCDCYVYVPNVFTPDNNTINDVFHPIYECDFLKYELLIFNRWGMLLFESLDPTMSWNGMYRGSVVPTGVYVYSLKYSSVINNPKQIYGHVTVLK